MRTPKTPRATYRRDADGCYGVYADDHCIFETAEVAVMINLRGHRLMFHGRPAELQKKYGQLAKLAGKQGPEAAQVFNDYVMVSGHFDLGLLNDMLATGDARSLYVACEMQAARDTAKVMRRLAHA